MQPITRASAVPLRQLSADAHKPHNGYLQAKKSSLKQAQAAMQHCHDGSLFLFVVCHKQLPFHRQHQLTSRCHLTHLAQLSANSK